MIMDCNINQIPTVTNIQEIISMAAKHVFVQRPFFIM